MYFRQPKLVKMVMENPHVRSDYGFTLLITTPTTTPSLVKTSLKEADADDSDDEPTVHSLPFKVLGTCYSTSRQEALNEAFEHMSIWTKQTHLCQT